MLAIPPAASIKRLASCCHYSPTNEVEKPKPGCEKSLLSAGDIRKAGGAVCECRLLSMSSSLLEL